MPIDFPGSPDSPVSALDIAQHYRISPDSELIDPLMTLAGYSDEQVAAEVLELEAEIARQKSEIQELRRVADADIYEAHPEHSPAAAIVADLAEMTAAADALIDDMRDLCPRDLYAQIERLHSSIEDNCNHIARKLCNHMHASGRGEQ